MKVKGNLQVSGALEGITFTNGDQTFSKEDSLAFQRSEFYFGVDNAGRPEVRLRTPIQIPVATSINNTQFYITIEAGNSSRLNLKHDVDYLPFEQESGAVTNSYLIPDSPYALEIESVFAIAKSGSVGAGFYIVSAANPHKNGVGVPSLGAVTISSTAQRISPTSGNSIAQGDALLLSIFSNSSGKNVRLGVRLKRA